MSSTPAINSTSATTNSTAGATITNVADRVARSADSALHTTQAATNKAFDRLSGKVESLRVSAHPLVDKVAARADQAGLYVQDQPVKSLLIAAAAGAALITLLSWVTRSRR